MKVLILISLCITSLSLFSAELGEDQKGECPYASQSSKREAKVVVAPVETEIKQEESHNVSK
ncbi:MAG: hypothetical protein ACXVLQ_07325 [Bacteriovorax sp.]